MSDSDYRPVPIEEVMARFSPERQARIHERAREILLEEATLRELRTARGLTQEKMAETLEIAQENISRLEGRGDVKLSSLAAYVQALGGEAGAARHFPGRLFDSPQARVCRPHETPQGSAARSGMPTALILSTQLVLAADEVPGLDY